MKNQGKRLAALFLALAVAFGGLGLASLPLTRGAGSGNYLEAEELRLDDGFAIIETQVYPEWSEPDYTREDLQYEHYEFSRFQTAVKTFLREIGLDREDMAARPTKTADAATVEAALNSLLLEYDYITTLNSFIQYQYSQDITAEQVSDELTYSKTLALDVFNEMLEAMQGVQNNSVLGPVFDSVLGEAKAEDLRESVVLTPRQKTINDEITKLEQEFDKLDDSATGRKGEIYLALVKLRNEFAREEGYANYYEMDKDQTFGRDFDDADLQEYYAAVKSSLVPLYFVLAYSLNWDSIENFEFPAGESATDIVERYIGNLSSELGESYSYLLAKDLYTLGDSPNNEQVSYTISLPYFNSAMIFAYDYGDASNLSTLIHEFGHFNTAVRSTGDAFFSHSNIDLAEIHSQGLEVLFLPYSEEIYGSAASSIRNYTLLNLVWSILTGCLYNEFETYVYQTDNLTIADLDKKFRQLSTDYGTGSQTGQEWMFWHMYHAPLYYLSYTVSAMAAASLLPEMRRDWRGAVDKYLKLTSFGEERYPFRQALQEAGLPDIFEASSVAAVAGAITNFVARPLTLVPEEANANAPTPALSPAATSGRPTISLPEYGTTQTQGSQVPSPSASGGQTAPTTTPDSQTAPNTTPDSQTTAPDEDFSDEAWNGDSSLTLRDRLAMLPGVLRYIWSGEFWSDLFSALKNRPGDIA